MIEVTVAGVRMEMPSNTPIVLLQEVQGLRYLPIWIGAVEATSIAYAQQGVEPPRPMTHDLYVATLAEIGATVTSVRITDLNDGVFYSVIDLTGADGSVHSISARPSDALAIALRVGVPILATEAVFDAAGVELPEDDEGAPEDQVEAFREFLEGVSPEDFEELS